MKTPAKKKAKTGAKALKVTLTVKSAIRAGRKGNQEEAYK